MLNLDSHLTISEEVVKSPNLCDRFTDADLRKIGGYVNDLYQQDVQSRENWLRRTEAAMDLAMQLQKDKSFPWPGCSNIAFPLVTIAAMQFHARAYPTIVNGRSIVQCRIGGDDPDGILKDRAEKLGKHMSWQLLEEDEEWEEHTDRALLNVSIVGCGFKKSYFNPRVEHNTSEFVPAKDLVVNYYAKNIDDCQIKTHIISMDRNTMHERITSGLYQDVRGEGWYMTTPSTPEDARKDDRSGTTPPQANDTTPFAVRESHVNLDLDGDGYAEPYIVTWEESACCVLRIVTRFDRMEDVTYNTSGEVVRISSMEYFTKIPFIPSPDGAIYDIGFGVLLGPLNESTNAAINQLFDAGTLSNTAGGFLGRGAKLRGGVYSFRPFEWQRVDASGDDLRKSIFPLPVREPSAVMFNLLNLIIEYTNRVSGSVDMVVGENPGQNTPAETSRTMMEQGQKIYSAIFKRIWRSMKREFKKLYLLNALHLPTESTFGDGVMIRREDYRVAQATVRPAADPFIVSDSAKYAQALTIKEASLTSGGYNTDEVERNLLRALHVDNIDVIYPGLEAKGPPPPDVKIQLQEMKNQVAMAQLEQEKLKFIVTMQETARLNSAKIAELEASAAEAMARAQTEPEKQRVIAFRAGIEAMREQNKQQNEQIALMMEERNARATSGNQRSVLDVEAGPSDTAVL